MTSTFGVAQPIALIIEIALGMDLIKRTVTEMFDELVAKLRDHNACIGIKTLDEAADAIEELSREYESVAASLNKSVELVRKLQQPRWIPVTERLPGKHQWCLVVGENLYDMDFINSQGAWHMHDKPFLPIDYWMPLPEPPKGETP